MPRKVGFQMDYINFGKSGVKVSRIALGLGLRSQPDEDVAQNLVEHAIDRGITFIDCANVYGRGWSETILGNTLKRLGNRHDLVVTTKVGGAMGDAESQRGLSRDHILREIDNSLRRLQLDYVDVYYIHQPDPGIQLEETIGAMHEVVRQGKARYVGVSNHAAAEVVELLWTAERE